MGAYGGGMKTISKVEARIDRLKELREESWKEREDYREGSTSYEELKEEAEVLSGQIEILEWVLAE